MSARSKGRARPLVCGALFLIGLLPAAQASEFDLSAELVGFADFPVSADTDRDSLFAGRIDTYLTGTDIWEGGSFSAQLEYVDGDDFLGADDAGVLLPTNVFTAVPRATGKNANLSLTFAHEFSDSTRLTFGKYNVVQMARSLPIGGGGQKGGFQWSGIAAPITFVLPPYVLGSQLSVATESVNYNLWIYNAKNAQGSDFWDDPLGGGTVFNGTATYKTQLGGLPGFYSLNLAYSTAEGTDYESIITDPDFGEFAPTTKGSRVASIKFQQYLAPPGTSSTSGWGVFGQITFADGNPNELDNLLIFGLSGSAPWESRSNDRWGIAWSRYFWSDSLIEALRLTGGNVIRDEYAGELFYEAEINDSLRFGANAIYTRPGVPGFDDVYQLGVRLRANF